MHILLVKTSSLGDVIHNLPVVSDLRREFPEARIDWCVEEAFAAIPRLHPGVGEVIPVAVRRWRKALFQRSTWREIAAFRRRIGATEYSDVLDTQGLVKSALITRAARGRRLGYAAEVVREPLAARAYDETFVIPPNAHAVLRNRWLASAAFDYALDERPLDYGIVAPAFALPGLPPGEHAVLLTATSRADKLWADAHWVTVGQALRARGLTPVLPAGSPAERARAAAIAEAIPGSLAAPPLGLPELAALLGSARLTIGVDTGLVHLAAALRTPTIALYAASDPELTGVLGNAPFRNLGGRGRPPTPAAVLVAADQILSP